MKHNTARDLFLLSAVAFKSRRYDEAAKLFSASLSSDDSPEFLQSVQELVESSLSSEEVPPKASLATIAQAMASSMDDGTTIRVSLSDAEDADVLVHGNRDLDQDEGDEVASTEDDADVDEEDDDETYSDEIDPQTPGQRMVLPSLSKVVDSAIAVKSTPNNNWTVQVKKPTSVTSRK